MTGRPQLVDVTCEAGSVHVVWSDGRCDAVTPIWMRDACRCEECRTSIDGQRRFDISTIESADIADVDAEPDLVRVRFGDGHLGLVPAEVLLRRRPTSVDSGWGAERGPALRRSAIDAADDLAPFLDRLDRDGVAVATGIPDERGAVEVFAERIGFVRATNYGRTFDVEVEPDPTNLASSNAGLPLHTDNPYRDPVPTVQLLHCLRAAGSGGTTLLSDGWAAARRLRVIDPDAFEVLISADVPFRYADEHVDLRARGKLIEVDGRGDVVGVRVNSRSMEPPDLPSNRLDGFYRAHRSFVAELARPDAVVELRLRPGELIALDNRRVLHGRAPYDPTDRRLLQGCYIDIDHIRSAVRRQRTDAP